ncbi:MAG TPA: acyltransferase [Allosphingosinicella sp.]
MTIESTGQQPKLASLQYLRAFAALGVVAFHAANAAGYAFPDGAYGVDIFFVISGFVMVWISSAATRPHDFLSGRIRRIVPLYWVVTFAWIAAISLSLGDFPFGPGGLASSFLFIPYGAAGEGRHYFPIVQVGWTLNYEMMFYAVFAATLLLRRSFQLLALSAVFIALVTAGLVLKPLSAPWEFWTNPILLHFLAGAWLAASFRPEQAGVQRWLACCVLIALFLLEPPLRTALLLVAAALVADFASRMPKFAPLLRTGDASYALYLWHPLAIAGLMALIADSAAPPWLIFVACIAVSLIAGFIGHRLVEQPLLRLWKSRRPKALEPQ